MTKNRVSYRGRTGGPAPASTGGPPSYVGEPTGLPEAPARLLLVDDQPENLLALEAVLEDLGPELVRATSGEEALRHLLRSDFAAVLLDVHMPGLDGFETARLIRQRERCRTTPILFLTAVSTDDTHVARGYSLGAVDYLFKPLVPEFLRAKVAVFLQLFQQAQRLQAEVAQRQQAEAEVRLLNAELECRVRQRTAELERSRKELAESNRRKDEWLAILSHELRNPLAAVRNAIELLRRSNTEARDRAIEVLDRQVRHQERLLEDLLDIARIGRGKIELQRRPVDLGQVVRETLEDHLPVLDEAGLLVSTELPEEPVSVSGDATRLAQILGNLLTNAMRYTDCGGEVEVRLAADPVRGWAELTVRDTGTGIEPALLPRVFHLFTQGNRTRERSRGGLGLGLALVRGLAELHGGSVRARSDGPGRGSEFTVRLPVVSAECGPRNPESEIHNPRFTACNPGCRRVLIVEDNRDAAETLRDILELAGHCVEIAHTGPDGVEAARRFGPDVVVCDLGLPGLDGHGVARALRAAPGTRDARLIAVTGYGQENDRRESRLAGFDHHLTKPVNPAALCQLIATDAATGERPG